MKCSICGKPLDFSLLLMREMKSAASFVTFHSCNTPEPANDSKAE